MMTNKTNTPAFPDDLSFVQALVEWVRARCRRIDVEKRLGPIDQRDSDSDGVIGPVERTGPKELRRRLPALQEAEESLRAEMAARMAVNREAGPQLGLDALLEEAGVQDEDFCRALLILGTVAALGTEETSILDPVGTRGFGVGVSAEAAWAFLGMPLADRVKSRAHLLPMAPLMRAGLVTLSLGRTSTPRDVPSACIEVTSRAFARVVGIPELAPERGSRAREG